MILKYSILSLITGNSPLDNLSYISSHENGHPLFFLCSAERSKDELYEIMRKISSMTKWSGMFSSSVSYVICQVNVQDGG